MVLWASPSQYHERHHDRLSRFCGAHGHGRQADRPCHSICKDRLHLRCSLIVRCMGYCHQRADMGSSVSSFRSPVVDEEGMRPGHWLGVSALWFLHALTLLFGWRDRDGNYKNPRHLSTDPPAFNACIRGEPGLASSSSVFFYLFLNWTFGTSGVGFCGPDVVPTDTTRTTSGP